MKKFIVYIFLAVIIIGAFALRVARLDSVPPGFYIDEASYGYNAYSILKTGMDEFGNRLPLYTPSFGTGKNPVQLYATVASEAAFGLNERAVRLPSAVFGTLAVLFTFLLAAELFADKRIGLIAALLLAVSPWSIIFSRCALETISLSCFITLGAYFLVLGLRKKWAFAAAGAAFGISLYCYAPAFSFVPLLLLSFFAVYRSMLKGRGTAIALGMIIFAALAVPHFVPGVKPPEQLGHLKAEIVFNPAHDARSLTLLKMSRVPGTDFLGRHPLLLRTAAVIRNYVSALSYNFLFTNGDTSTTRSSVPGFGVLHHAELLLLLAGLVFAALRRTRPLIFIVAWLLLSPIGNSFTDQWVPNAGRNITTLPAFQILFAYALLPLFGGASVDKSGAAANKGGPRILQKAAIAICILLALNVFSFFNAYFKEYPRQSAAAWQYGFREAIAFADENESAYHDVVVSMNLNYSYVLVLFYTKYDPAKLLAENPLRFAPGDVRPGELMPPRVGNLGRFHIGPPEAYKSNGPILYILAPEEMPELKTIEYLSMDGSKPYMRIAVSGDYPQGRTQTK